VAHSMLAVDLHYQKVIGRHVAGRSDTRNEETATAGQLRHSRAVCAGWEDPLLAIKTTLLHEWRSFRIRRGS
jgi:hypothetical protein